MGVVTYSRSGRVTSHAELEKRMRMSDIVTLLSRRRLQWVGHVLRMGDGRLPRCRYQRPDDKDVWLLKTSECQKRV